MKSRIINLLAGLSLLVCVSAGMLWVRSYWFFDKVGGNDHVLYYQSGTLYLETYQKNKHENLKFEHWSCRAGTDGSIIGLNFSWAHFHSFMGFGTAIMWFCGSFGMPSEQHEVMFFPIWGICFPLLLLPFFQCVKWYLRRNRVQSGFCVKSNYDLRATPDHCPECGTPSRGVGIIPPSRGNSPGLPSRIS